MSQINWICVCGRTKRFHKKAGHPFNPSGLVAVPKEFVEAAENLLRDIECVKGSTDTFVYNDIRHGAELMQSLLAPMKKEG